MAIKHIICVKGNLKTRTAFQIESRGRVSSFLLSKEKQKRTTEYGDYRYNGSADHNIKDATLILHFYDASEYINMFISYLDSSDFSGT